MEDASGTDHVRCGEVLAESFVPRLEVGREGESGRNELLRGPFALFGVRSNAKLVRNLAKHRRTPMSPTQLIPPTSPVQVSAGDGTLRRRFSHTGHGPLRALILSNLKWGGPCRGHYVLPQADIKSSAILSSRRIVGISYFPHTVALSGRDKVRPALNA